MALNVIDICARVQTLSSIHSSKALASRQEPAVDLLTALGSAIKNPPSKDVLKALRYRALDYISSPAQTEYDHKVHKVAFELFPEWAQCKHTPINLSVSERGYKSLLKYLYDYHYEQLFHPLIPGNLTTLQLNIRDCFEDQSLSFNEAFSAHLIASHLFNDWAPATFSVTFANHSYEIPFFCKSMLEDSFNSSPHAGYHWNSALSSNASYNEIMELLSNAFFSRIHITDDETSLFESKIKKPVLDALLIKARQVFEIPDLTFHETCSLHNLARTIFPEWKYPTLQVHIKANNRLKTPVPASDLPGPQLEYEPNITDVHRYPAGRWYDVPVMGMEKLSKELDSILAEHGQKGSRQPTVGAATVAQVLQTLQTASEAPALSTIEKAALKEKAMAATTDPSLTLLDAYRLNALAKKLFRNWNPPQMMIYMREPKNEDGVIAEPVRFAVPEFCLNKHGDYFHALSSRDWAEGQKRFVLINDFDVKTAKMLSEYLVNLKMPEEPHDMGWREYLFLARILGLDGLLDHSLKKVLDRVPALKFVRTAPFHYILVVDQIMELSNVPSERGYVAALLRDINTLQLIDEIRITPRALEGGRSDLINEVCNVFHERSKTREQSVADERNNLAPQTGTVPKMLSKYLDNLPADSSEKSINRKAAKTLANANPTVHADKPLSISLDHKGITAVIQKMLALPPQILSRVKTLSFDQIYDIALTSAQVTPPPAAVPHGAAPQAQAAAPGVQAAIAQAQAAQAAAPAQAPGQPPIQQLVAHPPVAAPAAGAQPNALPLVTRSHFGLTQLISQLARSLTHLTELKIHGENAVGRTCNMDLLLDIFLTECSSLKRITVEGLLSTLPFNHPAYLLKLDTLSLKLAGDRTLTATECLPGIERLLRTGVTREISLSFKTALEFEECKRLGTLSTHLDVAFEAGLSEDAVLELSNLTNIRTLKLTHTCLSPRAVHQLASMTSLKELVLANSPMPADSLQLLKSRIPRVTFMT